MMTVPMSMMTTPVTFKRWRSRVSPSLKKSENRQLVSQTKGNVPFDYPYHNCDHVHRLAFDVPDLSDRLEIQARRLNIRNKRHANN